MRGVGRAKSEKSQIHSVKETAGDASSKSSQISLGRQVMGVIGSLADVDANTFHPSHGSKPDNGRKGQAVKPLVSLVVPAYNEAAIVEKNLTTLCRYMESLE